jgi:Caspase domain
MPGSDIAEGRPRALIIASDMYEDQRLGRLRSPSRDARELARALAEESIGGFDVRVALNSAAHVLRESIEDFFSGCRRNDVMLLYISCHGIMDSRGRLHFASSTTNIDRLASTSIPARFVQEQVDLCRAGKALLILDCCYSGAYARGNRSSADGRAEIETLEGSGRVVITSSTALEYSFESYTGETNGTPAGSVLTTALVEGLISGDADRDGDGLVSVNELYSYLYDRVREATPHQSPEMISHIRGDFIIARNPRARTNPAIRVMVMDTAEESTENDDPRSGLAYWSHVVEALREGADKLALASALNRVGEAHVMLQHPEEAVSPLEQSAAICRDLGNRNGEITALTELITVYGNLGYLEDSDAARRRIADLYSK